MEVAKIKNYLRIDHSLDDDLLIDFEKAAELYIYSSIEKSQVEDERFDLAVLLLIGHFYNNRSATTADNIKHLPLGITSLIHQLRGLGSDSSG